jgi:hypothetical protein
MNESTIPKSALASTVKDLEMWVRMGVRWVALCSIGVCESSRRRVSPTIMHGNSRKDSEH